MSASLPGEHAVLSRRTQAAGLGSAVERARILAAGALGGGVIHELANLLTILDGAHQMRRLGLDPPVTGAVDAPASRCQRLVEAFRQVFAAFPATGRDLDAGTELGVMAPLLQLRLRGCRTRINHQGPPPGTVIADHLAVPLRVLVLAAILSELEACRASGDYPSAIALEAEVSGGRLHRISVVFTGPLGKRPEHHPALATGRSLLKAARDVASSLGTRLSRIEVDGGCRMRIVLPAPRTV